MRALHADLITELQKQHNESPWLWGYQIELEATPVSAPTAFLTSATHEWAYKGHTYRPYPVTHEPIRAHV